MKRGVFLFMERTMSVEDKIRRAEEIYNRRRENEYKTSNTRVSVENSKTNENINQRLKKMIIQIIVCMAIYFIFYYIINNNYIFSEDFKNKCQEILSYDISFTEMYKKISEAITNINKGYQEIVEKSKQNNENIEDHNIINQENQNQENLEQNNQEETSTENFQEEVNEQEQVNSEENIGGAIEEVSQVEENEDLTEEDQMKRDSEEIKAKVSFIKPLEGIITSVFGWRNPTVTTVSKYHTGIDIAADQGTNIISATNGKVILASSKGAYGNHLKIQIENVVIIYAHCLSLEVNEGDEVYQGQVIAKVGSTGNSTGPHLHFEIRKEDRYVDPSFILDF